MTKILTKDYPLKLEVKCSEAQLTAAVAQSVARMIKNMKVKK